MNNDQPDHLAQLEKLARREMLDRGFLPDFSEEVLAELNDLDFPAKTENENIKDLRGLLWCSIDNDDSLDLDQLTAAEVMDDGKTRIYVAIADVDAIVDRGTNIDAHALHNTTSIYTTGKVFPMLPDKLSTNLTSVNPGEDRVTMVVDMVIDPDGLLEKGTVYRARVHNHAKLAYNSVAAWLQWAKSRALVIPLNFRKRSPIGWKHCATAMAPSSLRPLRQGLCLMAAPSSRLSLRKRTALHRSSKIS